MDAAFETRNRRRPGRRNEPDEFSETEYASPQELGAPGGLPFYLRSPGSASDSSSDIEATSVETRAGERTSRATDVENEPVASSIDEGPRASDSAASSEQLASSSTEESRQEPPTAPAAVDASASDNAATQATSEPAAPADTQSTTPPADSPAAAQDEAATDEAAAPAAADSARREPGDRTQAEGRDVLQPAGGLLGFAGGAATSPLLGGPAAETEDDEESGDSDPELSIPDNNATAALIDSWHTEPIAPVAFVPLSVAFDAQTTIELTVMPAPGQAGGHAQASGSLSALSAGRQASESYALFAADAHRHHEEVLARANQTGFGFATHAQHALERIDELITPTVDGLLGPLSEHRLELEKTANDAEAFLAAAEHAARLRIGGAAAYARSRIRAASADAERQFPGIRNSLRQRFESLYNGGATEVEHSGTWAAEQLRSEGKKSATATLIPESSDAEAAAQVEAKRKAIPSQLDSLASAISSNSTQGGTMLRSRISDAPPGGQSIADSIEGFITSLRNNVNGTAAAGGQAAVQSLTQRGDKAVASAQAQALKSLREQYKAARRAVRHGRKSGERQFVTQRSAALTRLSGLRRQYSTTITQAATKALESLTTGARAALRLYADSVQRTASTLQHSAKQGPAALLETSKRAFGSVARTLNDGHILQTHRLEQLSDGASRTVDQQINALPVETQTARGDFERTMLTIAATLTTDITDGAQRQGKGFAALSKSVARSANSFTQPLTTMYAVAISNTVTQLNPIFTGEQSNISQMVARRTGDDLRKVNTPLPEIQSSLDGIAKTVDKTLNTKTLAIKNSLDQINMDEDAIMAAARGVTQIQGGAIRAKFSGLGGGNLDARLRSEHEGVVSGLSDDEYNAVTAYLDGRTADGAIFELATTRHWYGGEGARAESIIRDLTDEQRAQVLGTREHMTDVARSVRGSLSGVDLNVFDALMEGRIGRADAYRMLQDIDRARERNDMNALHEALTKYSASTERGGHHISSDERRAELLREFAHIRGEVNLDAGQTISQERAASLLATYATRDVQVEEPAGEGETITQTYRVEGPDRTLAVAIATYGPESYQAQAARILREGERSGKPDTAALETAVVDPRLNPVLTPNLSAEQRAQARLEQDRIYMEYARLAQEQGVASGIRNAQEARQLAAERLQHNYGNSESDQLGAEYVASIVTQDRPDPVVALRYATLGFGTDEALIHRTLQRMSRSEIRQARADYRTRYGDDLFSDLGVYGRTDWTGLAELSGDDRLSVERELMGVPQNDREAAEVALYTNLQQQRETGIFGGLAAGEAETRALHRGERRLRSAIGENITFDEFGRPVIGENPHGTFNERGNYQGSDVDAFSRAVNFAETSAESYAATIDRVASYVTTTIAVLGAVAAAVATVLTGGAASPLLMAAIAGVSGGLSIAANTMLRGGRYGWEQAATDLGMTGVQMLTAGVGAQLGLASRGGAEAVRQAALTGVATKMGQITGSHFADMLLIGGVTSGLGSLGSTALSEQTWDKGWEHGLGQLFQGTMRGVLSGVVTASVTNGIEAMPFKGDNLGNAIQGMSTAGGVVRGGLGMLGRGVGRSAISTAGAVAGRGSELLFDSSTGEFHGDTHDVLMSLGEAGGHSAMQGFFEGTAEAPAQQVHDIRAQRLAQQRAARQAGATPPGNGPTPGHPSETDISPVSPRTTPPAEAETARTAPPSEGEAPARVSPGAGDETAAPRRVAGEPAEAGAQAQRVPTAGPETLTPPTHTVPAAETAPGEVGPMRTAPPEAETGGPRPPTPVGGEGGGDGGGGGRGRGGRGTPEEQRAAEIFETMLTEIGEKRRMAARGGLVDESHQDMPEGGRPFLRRGEHTPGRSRVPPEVAAHLREVARKRFGRMLQEALLDPGQHNEMTLAARNRLTHEQLEHVETTGRLPPGVEFHHLLTVADFPEFAHMAEAGTALPKDVHAEAGHAGDPTRPVEAGTLLDPGAETRPEFHLDPEARKYYRARQADIAEGRAAGTSVDRDIIIEQRAQLKNMERRAERLRQRGRPDAELETRVGEMRRGLSELEQQMAARAAAEAEAAAPRISEPAAEAPPSSLPQTAGEPEQPRVRVAVDESETPRVRVAVDEPEPTRLRVAADETEPARLRVATEADAEAAALRQHELAERASLEETAPRRMRLEEPADETRRPTSGATEEETTPGGKPPDIEGAAARLLGTEMQLSDRVEITDPPAALRSALAELTGITSSLGNIVVHSDPDGPGMRVTIPLEDGSSVTVRVVVGETERHHVASFRSGTKGDKTDFVVTLSSRARGQVHTRALAHEFAEIRAVRSGAGETDVLQPGGKLGRISAHDRGRLAEVEVLAARLRAAQEGSAPATEINAIRHEAEMLMSALGLVGKRSEQRTRVVLAMGELAGNRDAQRLLSTARHDAVNNPFRSPLTGQVGDLNVLARQVAHANAMGDTELAGRAMSMARRLFNEQGLFSWTGERHQDRIQRAGLLAKEAGPEGLQMFTRLFNEADVARQPLRERHAIGEPLRKAEVELTQAQLEVSMLRRKEAASRASARENEQAAKGMSQRNPEREDKRASAQDDLADAARYAAEANAKHQAVEELSQRVRELQAQAAAQSKTPRPVAVHEGMGSQRRIADELIGDVLQQELVRQRFGDQPGFQEWRDFRGIYFAKNRSVKRGDAEVEARLFAQWREGHYVHEETGAINRLRELRVLKPQEPESMATAARLQPSDLITVPEHTVGSAGEEIKTLRTLSPDDVATHREHLMIERDRLKAEIAKLPDGHPTLAAKKAELVRVLTNLRDAGEALGVAAGRKFGEEHPAWKREEFDRTGAGVPDLVYDQNPPKGRLAIVECKGPKAKLETRGAKIGDQPVDAMQGTPEYLRSLATAMMNSGDARLIELGDRILREMPNVDYYVVQQTVTPNNKLSTVTVEKYDMSKPGR